MTKEEYLTAEHNEQAFGNEAERLCRELSNNLKSEAAQNAVITVVQAAIGCYDDVFADRLCNELQVFKLQRALDNKVYA